MNDHVLALWQLGAILCVLGSALLASALLFLHALIEFIRGRGKK